MLPILGNSTKLLVISLARCKEGFAFFFSAKYAVAKKVIEDSIYKRRSTRMGDTKVTLTDTIYVFLISVL
jgi:hypothetical protein